MMECDITEIWNKLQIGDIIETNGDGNSISGRFRKGPIVRLDQYSLSIRYDDGPSTWNVGNAKGITVRYSPKTDWDKVTYLLTKGDSWIKGCKDKTELESLILENPECLVFKLVPIRKEFSIETLK